MAERANAAAQLADLERQVVQRENQISVLLGRQALSGSTWSAAHRAAHASGRAARPALRSAPAAA